MKFISKEAQDSNIIAYIFNSTQQPSCVFVTSFRPIDVVQMASDKPENYHSGFQLLLSRIILSQTCSNPENDSSEDGEVDYRLKKTFADLVKDAKSVAGFSPCSLPPI